MKKIELRKNILNVLDESFILSQILADIINENFATYSKKELKYIEEDLSLILQLQQDFI